MKRGQRTCGLPGSSSDFCPGSIKITVKVLDTGIDGSHVDAVLPAVATADMTGITGGTSTYALYGGTNLQGDLYDYIQKSETKNYYSVDTNGTVKGWWGTPGVVGENGIGNEIGENPAP